MSEHDEDVLCPACHEHTSRGENCCGMLEPCDCDECIAESEACMPSEQGFDTTPCDHSWVKRTGAPGVYCSLCETEYEEEGL